MNYMPILPVGMFDLFRNKNAFILPQFWHVPEYAYFYANNVWDTVIIDNAMYENPDMFDFNTMKMIAGVLRANQIFLVVPEDHNNPTNTIILACECISDNPPNGWKPMVILHGTPDDVKLQFTALKDIKDIGFGIAVSLWRAGHSRVALYKRCNMGRYYIHAMGLDNIDELVTLRAAGFNSVDSSIVASAAWNNINLQKERQIVRTGSPDDPVRVPITHPSCSSVMKNIVTRNIALINALCEG